MRAHGTTSATRCAPAAGSPRPWTPSAGQSRCSPTTRSPGAISDRCCSISATMAPRATRSGARSALKPDLRVVQALAGIARQRGDIDDAVDLFHRVIATAPDDTNTMLQLAGALAERDDLDAARARLREARVREAAICLRAAFGEALTLPMVYADASGRRVGARALRRRACAPGGGSAGARPRPDVRRRDRRPALDAISCSPIRAKTTALLQSAVRGRRGWCDRRGARRNGARQLAAVGDRRRAFAIGFASSFFPDGTCGRYFRSWIAGLDRARFEIILYNLRRDATPFLQQLSAHADRVRTYPGQALAPSAIAPTIRADALDVLVYPELGMNAPTFVLAALRLAPIQCAAWGHPVTTGHPTIDAFFSCAAMEPPNAAQHYTEKLIPLPGIGTRLRAARRAGRRVARALRIARWRAALPVPAVAVQDPSRQRRSLRARAGRRAGGARSCCSKVGIPRSRRNIVRASRRAFARAGSRLARIALSFFRNAVTTTICAINAVCDAMLDTLRWSGGNTSLDALAAGLPIVTLPGRFMRGRQSAGMLAHNGPRRSHCARRGRLCAHRAASGVGSRLPAASVSRAYARCSGEGLRRCAARARAGRTRSQASCAANDEAARRVRARLRRGRRPGARSPGRA